MHTEEPGIEPLTHQLAGDPLDLHSCPKCHVILIFFASTLVTFDPQIGATDW